MRLPSKVILTAISAVCLAGIFIAWRESPRFALGGGAHPAAVEVLEPLGECPVVAGGSHILFIGDSNTAGSVLPAKEAIFATRFGKANDVESRVHVIAHGGARAGDMRLDEVPAVPPGVAITMLGTNDAATRGWMRPGIVPTPLDQFRAHLRARVAEWQQHGAAVLVLAPPPGGSPAINARLREYRIASREIAQETGAAFRDPAEPIMEDGDGQASLQIDGLHLNANGHAAIAKWLAQCIVIR